MAGVVVVVAVDWGRPRGLSVALTGPLVCEG